MSGIYIASRTHHAHMWLSLRAEGVPICSTWIDEAGDDASPDLSDLWVRCLAEASFCDVLIAYIGFADLPVKGVLVEVGAALASGRPVLLVRDPEHCDKIGSWPNHPSVTLCDSLSTALQLAQRVTATRSKS